MRPLKLTIEGLRSFRTPVTIDFAGRDQIAIVGDTGAGKSSILDAITYALYRHTTFSKQPNTNQELMNASATQMRVVLKFSVSGQTWIVTRVRKRVGAGVDEFSRVDDDGQKSESVDSATNVDKRIESLIGLNSDAFLRTVVLPQGNFARLLVADTPTDRAAVLRQVWRTDELDEAGKITSEKAAEVWSLHAHLRAVADLYPEEPDQHLKGLGSKHKTTRKEAAAAKKALDVVNAAVSDLGDVEKEIDLCQTSMGKLEGADVSPLGRSLDGIESLAGDLAKKHEVLNQEMKETEVELQAIADNDGPSLAEVAKAMVGLEQIESEIGRIAEAAKQLGDLNKTKSAAKKKATSARQTQENCKRKVEEQGSKRQPLIDTLAKAADHRATVEKRFDACEKARANLSNAQDALIEHQEAVKLQRVQTACLSDAARASEQEREEAEQALVDSRRVDCAASAAHGLRAGDDCPICRQELPANWQAPASPDVDEASRKVSNAKAAAAAAQKSANESSGKLEAARVGCRAAERNVQDAKEERDGAMQALRELLPSLGGELPEKEAVLHPLDEKLDRCRMELDRNDAEQQDCDEALVSAKTELATAKVESKAVSALVAAEEKNFIAATVAVKGSLQALPGHFRPSIRVPDDWSEVAPIDTGDLSQKRESTKIRQAELEAEEAKHKELQKQKNALGEKQKELKRKYTEDVAEPLGDLLTKAAGCLKTITLEVGSLGLQQQPPAAPMMPPLAPGGGLEAAGAVRSYLEELQATLNAVRDAATKRIVSASAQYQDSKATLATFAKRFDVPEDDVQAVVDAADGANNEAQVAAANAKREFEDFSAIVDTLRELREVLAQTEAKGRVLADLAASLKPPGPGKLGPFPKWLTLRRSHSLLSHASVVLKQMSSDRYAFAHPDEADSPWLVLDNDTGQARSPASLSGGEQFIASLALALGMVEMMARGGGKLESLFLDEGFGSLDSHNLDAAVEALTMVAARGRMVGVISHVRAVAEQFDNVLAVSRGEGGSRAVWLSDSERHELTADALAGLLE